MAMPFSRLGAILAHNLGEAGTISGGKDVRKERLRPWQVSVSAKHDAESPKSPETCWTKIAAFGRVAQHGARPAFPIRAPCHVKTSVIPDLSTVERPAEPLASPTS
jgi:hypothetical protein